MSLVERWRAILPMTFVVWLVQLALSAVPAAVGTAAVWALLKSRPEGTAALFEPGGALLLATARRMEGASIPGMSGAAFAGLGAILLLTPWLATAWVSTLRGSGGIRRALLMGGRLYVRSVALSVLIGAVTVATLVGAALLPGVVHLALSGHPNARLHDLSVLGATLPAGAVVFAGLAWADLARCALVARDGAVLTSVRDGLKKLDLKTGGAFLGLWMLASMLGVAAVLVALSPPTRPGSIELVVVVGPTITFARACLRGLWLAYAWGRVAAPTPGSGFRGAPSGGSTLRIR